MYQMCLLLTDENDNCELSENCITRKTGLNLYLNVYGFVVCENETQEKDHEKYNERRKNYIGLKKTGK